MTTQKGLAARLRQRADEFDAAERREHEQATALDSVKSLAYGVFIAGLHRARCEIDFRTDVQRHKDAVGFKGRFEKNSDEWHAMLAATDPVYRRLEIARHLEKHTKGLLLQAWRVADLKADESDFWAMANRMPVDATVFLCNYLTKNRLIVEADAEDDQEGMRRAEANAAAAEELMFEFEAIACQSASPVFAVIEGGAE